MRKTLVIAVVLVLVAATGLLAADMGTKVTLNFMSMGDPPPDLDFVTSKMNEKLMQDLNCELKFSFLTWTDWQNKYNLMLVSGEPIDAAYGASWLNYYAQAKKGAFLALDEMLPKYTPALWAIVARDKWDGVRVNGKIYGVARWDWNFVQRGFQFREDLRMKYKLPAINSIDSMIAYLDAIKKNEPGMVGLAEPNWLSELLIYTTKYQWVDGHDPYGPTRGMLVADPNKPSELLSIFDLPEYKTMARKMKEWADKGYWAKDILSNPVDAGTGFLSGKVAATIQTNPDGPPKAAVTFAQDHPGWKVDLFLYPELNNSFQAASPAQDVTVILPRSKNPERALMVIEKFMTEKPYYMLHMYGVQGRNFNFAPDGTIDKTGIPKEQQFVNIAIWSWLNKYWQVPGKITWDKYQPLMERLTRIKKPNPFSGFAIDLTNVQAEAAAITQVYNQYAIPLQTGLVDNVDTAYKQMMDRFKAAGFEKWKAEIQKQLQAWLAAK